MTWCHILDVAEGLSKCNLALSTGVILFLLSLTMDINRWHCSSFCHKWTIKSWPLCYACKCFVHLWLHLTLWWHLRTDYTELILSFFSVTRTKKILKELFALSSEVSYLNWKLLVTYEFFLITRTFFWLVSSSLLTFVFIDTTFLPIRSAIFLR